MSQASIQFSFFAKLTRKCLSITHIVKYELPVLAKLARTMPFYPAILSATTICLKEGYVNNDIGVINGYTLNYFHM
jgi:hypothetical protein